MLLELVLSHIVLELFFYNFALQHIDPTAKYNMSAEMWLHHLAVAIGGAHVMFLGSMPGFAAFFWPSCQLIVTEITTFFPVSFHNAIKHKKLTGVRSILLGVSLPSAFLLRAALSLKVVLNYWNMVQLFGGPAAVPFWWVSAATGGTILLLNTYWTIKCIYGGARTIRKTMALAAGAAGKEAPKGGKKGADKKAGKEKAEHAVYSEGQQAVYSEVSEGVSPRGASKRENAAKKKTKAEADKKAAAAGRR